LAPLGRNVQRTTRTEHNTNRAPVPSATPGRVRTSRPQDPTIAPLAHIIRQLLDPSLHHKQPARPTMPIEALLEHPGKPTMSIEAPVPSATAIKSAPQGPGFALLGHNIQRLPGFCAPLKPCSDRNANRGTRGHLNTRINQILKFPPWHHWGATSDVCAGSLHQEQPARHTMPIEAPVLSATPGQVRKERERGRERPRDPTSAPLEHNIEQLPYPSLHHEVHTRPTMSIVALMANATP
jgi:hypothetical protein